MCVVFSCMELFCVCVRVCLCWCDKTLSQMNWEHSVIAVGCWFGQSAIPPCQCEHSGVQPVDGSHTNIHTHPMKHTMKKKIHPNKQTHVWTNNHTAATCTSKHTGTWANINSVYTHIDAHAQTGLLCGEAFTVQTDLQHCAAGLV